MSAGSFSAALTALKDGQFVRRAVWKDEFLIMVSPHSVATSEMANEKLRHIIEDFPREAVFDYGNLRKFDLIDGSVENGWLPGPADLFAEDWIIYDMEDIEMSKLEWELMGVLSAHADATFDSLARLIVSQLEAMKIPVNKEDAESIELLLGSDRQAVLRLVGDYDGVDIQVLNGGYAVRGAYRGSSEAKYNVRGEGRLWVEVQKAMEALGKEKMSRRRFHRTLVSVEVLSEDKLPPEFELADIAREMVEGDLVGRWDVVNHAEINAKHAVQVLSALGSEAGFFNLTEEGEDAE